MENVEIVWRDGFLKVIRKAIKPLFKLSEWSTRIHGDFLYGYKYCVFGLYNHNNIIVPYGRYDWIEGYTQSGYYRVFKLIDTGIPTEVVLKGYNLMDKYGVKDFFCEETLKYRQWGGINKEGTEVLPCEYDEMGGIIEYGWSGSHFVTEEMPMITIVKNGVSIDYTLDFNKILEEKRREELREQAIKSAIAGEEYKRKNKIVETYDYDYYGDEAFSAYCDSIDGGYYDPNVDYDDEEMRATYDNIN